MKVSKMATYRSPKSNKALTLKVTQGEQQNITSGKLLVDDEVYEIHDGIPDFTYPAELAEIDQETKDSYDRLAEDYHKFSDIPFRTFKTPEAEVRKKIITAMNMKPDSKVLEIGCGCGDGSVYIADALNEKGELYLQELSPAFLNKAVAKLKNKKVPIEFSVANACYLSFPDNYFDVAHHFGGSNTFSEIEKCLSEMARVVKPGGKVVIGDEGMGSWLRNTEFGKIMINSNHLLSYSPPIKYLPTIAKDVKVEWIMMDSFFILEFTVAEKEPEANYHVPIPSERGGTHWSRYYGQLEGIDDDVKEIAYAAQKLSGKSMSSWLTDIVKDAALKELNNDDS